MHSQFRQTLPNTLSGRARQLMTRMLALVSLTFAGLMLNPHAQAATSGGTDGAGDQAVVQQLLDAMAQNDYQAFTAKGTADFAAIDQAQFTQVADSLSPRLQKGYGVEYLGTLRQQGLDISVWKVSFQDGGDDLLATLNVQDGRVGGFFLR